MTDAAFWGLLDARQMVAAADAAVWRAWARGEITTGEADEACSLLYGMRAHIQAAIAAECQPVEGPRRCLACGGEQPADESCLCFDNDCQ